MTTTSLLGASTLADSLSEALRKQIISGEVQPGLKLTEAWVAERFSVARPTAKASLDRLIAEGLLRRGPRRSSVVPRLSAADVNDIYFSRGPVESVAVRVLAESATVPPGAQRALALMQVAADQGDHVGHTEADVDFHRQLVAASDSPRLQRMHQTVMGETQLCIAQVRTASSVDLVALTASHTAILDAIRAGEPEKAVDALRADLDGCRQTLIEDVNRKASSAEVAGGQATSKSV